MSQPDPHDLSRFVKAQASYYMAVLAELGAGQKRGTWMDIFFPQLRALSASPAGDGIASLDEARAFMEHRLLSPRLLVCTRAVLGHKHRAVEAIFGPDADQFHASMTLFDHADSGSDLFRTALERYWDGEPHTRTLALLEAPAAKATGGGP